MTKTSTRKKVTETEENKEIVTRVRSVLSLLSPCKKDETLQTLNDLSVEELNEVKKLCDKVKEEASKVFKEKMEKLSKED